MFRNLNNLADNRFKYHENTRSQPVLPTEPEIELKPPLKLDAIFDIHGDKYLYSTVTSYGKPLGKGFLISQRIAITAYVVVPSVKVAEKCFLRFPD